MLMIFILEKKGYLDFPLRYKDEDVLLKRNKSVYESDPATGDMIFIGIEQYEVVKKIFEYSSSSFAPPMKVVYYLRPY